MHRIAVTDAPHACLKFRRASSRVAQKPHPYLICCAILVFLGIDSARSFYFAVQQLFVHAWI
jgi:hypothetical protein